LSLKDVLANSSVKTSTTKDSWPATSSATGNQSLGKDAFLQLLVTQLKNQNPLTRRTTARSWPSWRSSAAWKASPR
jgi:hypothetical protein